MKKISAIIICFLLLLTCTLTGCAGFSVDRVKYYNEVVASVNGTNLTRFELINAYNSYGQTYFNQSGNSEQEAFASTLDLLIDRELLYQFTSNEKDGNDNYIYKPTAYQVNNAVQNIFDSLDSQMEEYAKTAKRALNIKQTEDSESSNATAYKYSDYVYKKRADVIKIYYTDATFSEESPNQAETIYSKYKIKFIKEEEPTLFDELIDSNFLTDFTNEEIYDNIRTSYLEHLKQNIQEKYLKGVKFNSDKEKQTTAAALEARLLESFTKSLINYEYYLRDANGNKYSTNQDDLLNRYFERTFTSQIKGQYLTNFQSKYLENYEFSLNKLKTALQQKIKSNFNKYGEDDESYKNDMKNIGTDGDSILYHPDLGNTKFGYVIHTLFNFSEEQKTKIENLKTKYDDKTFNEFKNYYNEQVEENKLSKTDLELLRAKLNSYEKEYKDIVLQTEVVARDAATGVEEKVDTRPSLKDLLTDPNGDYANLLKNKTLNNFIDFMFKYTQDTATLSSGMPYVVGSYNEEAGETFSTNSAMEEAFTNESIKLMNMGKNSISNYSNLDVSNMCITSYGVHIVYFVNYVDAYDVNNYLTADFYDALDESKNNLTNKILNPLTGETYFDMLLDVVYPDSNGLPSNTDYSDYETTLLDSLQESYKVTIYSTKLKATKATIK